MRRPDPFEAQFGKNWRGTLPGKKTAVTKEADALGQRGREIVNQLPNSQGFTAQDIKNRVESVHVCSTFSIPLDLLSVVQTARNGNSLRVSFKGTLVNVELLDPAKGLISVNKPGVSSPDFIEALRKLKK